MIDYDDQMIYALRILEQYPEVLAYFRENISISVWMRHRILRRYSMI